MARSFFSRHEARDLLLDAGGGVVLELGVVLVEAGLRADRRREMEVDVGEELVGDEAEGLGGSVGGKTLGGRRGVSMRAPRRAAARGLQIIAAESLRHGVNQ